MDHFPLCMLSKEALQELLNESERKYYKLARKIRDIKEEKSKRKDTTELLFDDTTPILISKDLFKT